MANYPRQNGSAGRGRAQKPPPATRSRSTRSRPAENAPAVDREAAGAAVRKKVLKAKEQHEERLPESSTPKQWAMHIGWHASALAAKAMRLAERPSAEEARALRESLEVQLYQIVVWGLEGLEEIELRKQGG